MDIYWRAELRYQCMFFHNDFVVVEKTEAKCFEECAKLSRTEGAEIVRGPTRGYFVPAYSDTGRYRTRLDQDKFVLA